MPETGIARETALTEPVPDRRGPVIRRRIEAGALLKYARATGQTDPIYCDEEAARTGPFGALVAPPSYVGTFGNEALEGVFLPQPEFAMFLHTGDAVVQHEPIRAGDEIMAQATLTSLSRRQGRHGPMILQLATITLTNHHGRCVATVEVGMASFNPVMSRD